VGRAQKPSPKHSGRLAALDVLRGIAVLLVLGRHMGRIDVDGWLCQAFFSAWRTGGWVGVDLFFVLSGFLVSGLLFEDYRRHGRLSVGRFYVRRAFKIYPAFFFLTAVTVWYLLATHQFPGFRRLLFEVCFLQNYSLGLWSHTWSLAVEEHFYLLLPLLLLGLSRMQPSARDPFRPLMAIVALVAGTCLALRLVGAHRHDFQWWTHLFPTHLRLDSLLFGVLIGYAYHFHRDWFQRTFGPRTRRLALGGVACLCPAFMFDVSTTPALYTVGLTLIYVGSGLCLVSLLLTPIRPALPARLLGVVGVYSYSIYLWHCTVLEWGIPWLEGHVSGRLHFGVRLALYLVSSIALGVLMARLIEYPALWLRDRWFPSLARSPRPLLPHVPHAGASTAVLPAPRLTISPPGVGSGLA
jgi:peptidoglycan/LPS O-acetylase OafA/YrhL